MSLWPVALWRQLTRGLRVLVHRGAADRDVADEVRDYLERAAAAHVARGLDPAAARRAAAMEIGNVTVAREQVRAYGWENAVGSVAADLRYAARRLRASPGFTAVAALTLALGVGASTAVFGAVYPILFESLPYPNAGRIVTVSDVGGSGGPLDVTFGSYRELVARSRAFAATAVTKPWQPTLVGGSASAEPERLTGQRVSAGYFRVLGVAPARGSDFDAADDRPQGPDVVIVSDGLWRRRLGADPSVVGHAVTLDGRSFRVVGIMPRAFENVLLPAADLWAPLQYATVFGPDAREWGHHLRMVARLRAGASVDEARRELDAIARAPRPEFARVPWAALEQGLLVTALQQDVTRAVRPTLLAVLGAVLLVLAIACVNVTNLLLARGARRGAELAMRTALGAGRGRLVRQLLTESLVLAAVGGTLGTVVAALCTRTFVALAPADLPRLAAIHVDGRMLAVGVAVTAAVGIVVGIVPALQVARGDLHGALQQGSRRATGGHRRMRGALVVAEVALALVLLAGAGLLLRSLDRLFAVPVGVDPARVLTMEVQESGNRFTTDEARHAFFADALDAARGVPGVTSAAFTSLLPLGGVIDGYGVHFERDGAATGDDGAAMRYAVTPGYLATMRIPLLGGRALDARDAAGMPRAVLMNVSFATRVFGTPARAIGARLRFGPDDGQRYTVVGVVGDVRQTSLAAGAEDALYVTPQQWHWADRAMTLVVRARGDAAALAPALRRAIWSVDRNQPIVRVATMPELVARSEAGRRFALVLFEAFALVALVMATIGIYGVLAGNVAERMRELGVRAALGASPRGIVALVVRQGMGLTAIGVVLGIAGAAAASRTLASLLFGVSRFDPLTYGGVVVLLAAVSALACALPAWRASRVDPSVTLRSE